MKNRLFSYRALGLAATLGALLMAPPAASAAYSYSGDTTFCEAGQFSQPFQSLKDTNWYTRAAGTGAAGFEPGSWQLTGNARLLPVTVEGRTVTVLDLPGGSKAYSPRMCVTRDYPRARAVMRNAVGGGGISFRVAYEGTPTWETPKNTGQIHGEASEWTAAGAVNLQPYGTQEWQPMRIVLEAPAGKVDYQVAQLWIDPRYGH